MGEMKFKVFVGVMFLSGIAFAIYRGKKGLDLVQSSKDNAIYTSFHKEKKDIDFWLRRKYVEYDYIFFQIAYWQAYLELVEIINFLKNSDRNIKELKEYHSDEILNYFDGGKIMDLDSKDLRLESDMSMAPGYNSTSLEYEEFLIGLLAIDFKDIRLNGIMEDGLEYKLLKGCESPCNHGVLLAAKGNLSYEEIFILVELLKAIGMKNIISNRY